MKATKEEYNNLKQGDKIRFKWWGNKELVYTGRIEENNFGDKFFVNEFNYKNDSIREECEGMRYYNRLQDYSKSLELEIDKLRKENIRLLNEKGENMRFSIDKESLAATTLIFKEYL